MLRMQINQNQLNAVINQFAVDDREVQNAKKRALTKLLIWSRSQLVKGLSQKTGIQQKIIRNRIRTSRKSSMVGIIWEGTIPISLIKMNPRQLKKGVKAAKIFRQSAFIVPAKRGASHLQVYKRIGRERLPVQKQTEPIHDKARQVLDDLYSNLEARLHILLKQELRWEIRRRGNY